MILILGGSGFIGRNIVNVFSNANLSFLAPMRRELNLSDLDAIKSYFLTNNISTIIWSISSYHPDSPQQKVDDHILFKNILTVCELFCIKIIYLGSMSEVNLSGVIENKTYYDLAPDNAYGKSKYKASLMLAQSSSRVRSYNLRLFGVFGEGEPHYRLIPHVIRNIVMDKSVSLTDCMQIRDFVNVKVVCDVIMRILENSEIPEGLYNIGSGVGLKIKCLLLRAVPHEKKGLLVFSDKTRRVTDLDEQVACLKRSNAFLELQQILDSYEDVETYIRNEIENADIRKV